MTLPGREWICRNNEGHLIHVNLLEFRSLGFVIFWILKFSYISRTIVELIPIMYHILDSTVISTP